MKRRAPRAKTKERKPGCLVSIAGRVSAVIGFALLIFGAYLTYVKEVDPRMSVPEFRTVGGDVGSLEVVLKNESEVFTLRSVRATLAVDATFPHGQMRGIGFIPETSDLGDLARDARSSVDFSNRLINMGETPTHADACLEVTYRVRFYGERKQTLGFHREFAEPSSEWIERANCETSQP